MELQEIFDNLSDKITQLQLYQRTIGEDGRGRIKKIK